MGRVIRKRVFQYMRTVILETEYRIGKRKPLVDLKFTWIYKGINIKPFNTFWYSHYHYDIPQMG